MLHFLEISSNLRLLLVNPPPFPPSTFRFPLDLNEIVYAPSFQRHATPLACLTVLSKLLGFMNNI